ncbi:MAG: ABC transporter permease [Archangium sp.]|nr:ABC transporter permease [Archangium sp.]
MLKIIDTIEMALGTLRGNILRSVLTLLGLVIAAATVVAMMSFTEGLKVKLSTDFAQLGAGAFQVQKWPAMSFGPRDWRKIEKRADLTREQGEALRELPHIKAVSIEEYPHTPEKISTREKATKQNVDVCGGMPDYAEANGVTVGTGRFLVSTDIELGRRVVFVGADIADRLFPDEEPIGKEVRLRGVPFEIIGIAQRKGSIMGQSKDGFAVIPWPAYERTFGKSRNTNIALVATDPADVPVAIDEVVAKLRKIRGLSPQDENDFDYYSNETSASLFNDLASMVAAATAGICLLALLVGGIGIMNIMLVSVTERTREIGVRMALGARRNRILSQFLVESVALSFAGGALGVILGGAIALSARALFEVPAIIPTWAVLLSLGLTAGAGLLFGIYPAARASKLDPVEAMRTE